LNTNDPEQFTHAYYRPGDLIQRQGELARSFSVIEDGQVEILQASAQNPEPKVLAVLGKGDFFGEAALLGNRPHETTIRARTPVRLRQAGSALFSQITGTFAPFRELIAKAVIRRSGDFWDRLPEAKSLLEHEQLTSLLEPLPASPLLEDTSLADGISALEKSPTGELVILDKSHHLWGTLDRNDLQQIVTRVAVIPIDKRGEVTRRKLQEFLAANPLAVTLEDSTLAAYTTMLDHGISWLPVIQSKEDPRPVGYLRADRIASRLTSKIALLEDARSQVAR
jgi:NADH:ubiquinone reductase (H+-translocating)